MFDPVISFETGKRGNEDSILSSWNKAKIRLVLSSENVEILIHAFLSSRTDYFSAMLSGFAQDTECSCSYLDKNWEIRTGDSSTVISSLVRADFKVLLLNY